MSEPYLSEIRIFSFNFAPKSWAFCNGQLLPINQYQALFALLGTTYGGNGVQNFALPNLQGRVAMSFSNSYPLGQSGGEEQHTLTITEMPTHTHSASGDVAAGDNTTARPGGAYLANTAPVLMYSSGSANLGTMSAQMVTSVGGSEAHENRQPYLTLTFCIALAGIFPSGT